MNVSLATRAQASWRGSVLRPRDTTLQLLATFPSHKMRRTQDKFCKPNSVQFARLLPVSANPQPPITTKRRGGKTHRPNRTQSPGPSPRPAQVGILASHAVASCAVPSATRRSHSSYTPQNRPAKAGPRAAQIAAPTLLARRMEAGLLGDWAG